MPQPRPRVPRRRASRPLRRLSRASAVHWYAMRLLVLAMMHVARSDVAWRQTMRLQPVAATWISHQKVSTKLSQGPD